MINCWRLDDGRQTLVIGSNRGRMAEIVYWGPRLPDEEDLTSLFEACAIDVTGGDAGRKPRAVNLSRSIPVVSGSTRSCPSARGRYANLAKIRF